MKPSVLVLNEVKTNLTKRKSLFDKGLGTHALWRLPQQHIFKKERWNIAKMKKNKAHTKQMEAINMTGTYFLSVVENIHLQRRTLQCVKDLASFTYLLLLWAWNVPCFNCPTSKTEKNTQHICTQNESQSFPKIFFKRWQQIYRKPILVRFL